MLILGVMLLLASLQASRRSLGRIGVCGVRKEFLMTSSVASLSTFAGPPKTLESLGSNENTLLKYLIKENVEAVDGSRITPRQVTMAHYTCVLPEPVPEPTLVAYSEDCARLLNLDINEVNRPEFTLLFAGNKLFPHLDQPYCTVYGCHSGGQWFGQLGTLLCIALI